MADQLVDQLDRAVEVILAAPRMPRPAVDPAIADLLAIAEDLRFLPDDRFREQLLSGLNQERTMTPAAAQTTWIPKGFHSVTPYPIVEGAARFIDFLKQAFGAEERIRVPKPDGSIMHAAVAIGDSMMELADAGGQWKAMPGAFHLYVEDVDRAYQRAVDAGGTTLRAPVDQFYGDREACIRDPLGNTWYIATHQGASPVPEGLRTVTPYMQVGGVDNFIGFLQRAFNAAVEARHAAPDGSVMHAKIRIGDSVVELGEAHGQWQPMPSPLHVYVENADAVYQAALEAGATSLMPPKDEPYGDRAAGIVDPVGNYWFIATHIKDVVS